ncbi:MAG: ribonuclease III [Methyloligellaceae bacterium]
MQDRADTDLRAFTERLGYEFRDRARLRLALTHASARVGTPDATDNERLEFLGDRVLGLAIAELLSEMFPEASEGDLARRFNRLVRKETCAAVAQDLDLGSYVIMSCGEEDSGGRGKTTILGDACEAILGAVFLDGGFDASRGIIRSLWGPYVRSAEAVPADAKSALQEWAQGRGLPLPRYVEVARQGPDHAPHFTAEVQINGLESARGDGRNKRVAEQTAASAMLVREGVWEQNPDA